MTIIEVLSANPRTVSILSASSCPALHYKCYRHPLKQPRPDSLEVYSAHISNRMKKRKILLPWELITLVSCPKQKEEILVPVILHISWHPLKKFKLVEDIHLSYQKFK